MVKINLSQIVEKAGDGTFPVLDPGVYTLELEEAKFRTSSTGNPMISVRFKEPEMKISVFENWVLTEKAAFRLGMFLRHTGVEVPGGDLEPDTPEFDDWLESLVGTEVTAKIKVSTREYQGQERKNNEIENYVDGKTAKGPKKKRRTI